MQDDKEKFSKDRLIPSEGPILSLFLNIIEIFVTGKEIPPIRC